MTSSLGLPDNVLVFERGWLSANNILFKGRDETALVDTGYVTHAAQTVALVEAALDGRPLDRLFNTHLHSDHCGGNAALQSRYPRVRTAIAPGEASAVQDWDETALSYRATGQQCPRFRFDELMTPGTEVMLGDSPWQVHAAAGHDPCSVIFFEPASRTLISADALWENGFGVVFPELIGEPSFGDVAATLDLIEALSPRCVIPGHGAVFHDVAAALERARSRLVHLQRNPETHARHALKVLLKFKLLESQAVPMHAWRQWILETPYLEVVRARFFPGEDLFMLCDGAFEELVASDAATADADWVRNR